MPKITARYMKDEFQLESTEGKKDNLLNLYHFITEGLATGDLKAGVDITIPDVAAAMGVLDPMDVEGSVRKLHKSLCRRGNADVEELFSESHAATIVSSAFQAVTGDILTAMVKDAYNTDGQYISDQLCTVERTTLRRQRIAQMRGLGDLLEVPENHPYEETAIGERWVQTDEKKYGRVVSASMESLLFDRSGAIPRAMNDLGKRAREKKESLIVNGVQDLNTDKVWRPMGVPTTLYATANYNKIGAGGAPTGYTSAIPLASWQDIDTVLRFRATQVLDDRVDGTPQPIAGLNGPNCVILVPWGLKNAAFYATQYTGQVNGADSASVRYNIPVNQSVQSQVGPILWSRYVTDAGSGSTWYYGDFKSQFLWTELAPVATFSQGADSESGFDRDTNLRVKVRFMAGLSAIDQYLVTQVIGT